MRVQSLRFLTGILCTVSLFLAAVNLILLIGEGTLKGTVPYTYVKDLAVFTFTTWYTYTVLNKLENPYE